MAWIVSSGIWFSLDQRIQLSQNKCYGEKKASCASCKNYINCDFCETKPARPNTRFNGVNVSSEMVLSHKRFTIDRNLFPIVSVNTSISNGCVNKSQRTKDIVDVKDENRHVCRCKVQPICVHLLSKTRCLLHTNEMVDHLKATDLIHISTCNLEIKIFQQRSCKELKPEFPERKIIISSVLRMSSILCEASKGTYNRTCFIKMPSKFDSTHNSENKFITKADSLQFADLGSVRPTDPSRFVPALFVVTTLLLAIYTRRFKILLNRVSPGYENSIIVMFLDLSLSCFLPTATLQSFKWSVVASCISCSPGRTAHVLIKFRVVNSAMKIINYRQQLISVTALSLLVAFSCQFTDKISKHCFTNMYVRVAGSMILTLRLWALRGQRKLIASLFSASVSFHLLFRSILTTLSCFFALCHVKLVTYLQS
ncbi:uncharacterized protein ACNS7B_015712 isoform 2-T2 [Menidia menidia]